MEFECRATSFDSLKVKLILAPFGVPKLVRPSMNLHGMFFALRANLHTSSEHALKTYRTWEGLHTKLPTPLKSPFELKDDSIIIK